MRGGKGTVHDHVQNSTEPHHTVTYRVSRKWRIPSRGVASDVTRQICNCHDQFVRSEICGATLVKYSTCLYLSLLGKGKGKGGGVEAGNSTFSGISRVRVHWDVTRRRRDRVIFPSTPLALALAYAFQSRITK